MKKENKILEDQAWAHMRSVLDAEMPQKKKRHFGIFWWIGICGLVVVSVFAFNQLDKEGAATSVENSKMPNQIFAHNSNDEDVAEDNGSDNVVMLGEESKQENKSKIDTEIKVSANSQLNSNSSEKKKVVNKVKESIVASTAGEYKEVRNVIDIEKNIDEIQFVKQNIDVKPVIRKDKFETKKGRAEIKKEIAKAYSSDYNSKGFKKKINDTVIRNETTDNATALKLGISKLPMLSNVLLDIEERSIKDNTSEFVVYERPQIDLEESIVPMGEWQFGMFSSYQYLDKYFRGYDLGGLVEYSQGKFALSFKLGYESLNNYQDEVLKDASVGILTDSPESLLSNSRVAGFGLNDVILNKSSLMSEITLDYKVDSAIAISIGLGYKRLLRANTRVITALDSADIEDAFVDLDPAGELDVLNSSRVLNDPTVNRNIFYIPLEVKYSPIRNVQIGIGAQFFLNNAFEAFEEKNQSLYVRLSYVF